jgi:type I restriction enzyme S subunit
MAADETLITDHLDLWIAALKRKSTAGRGSSSKVELYGIKKLRELILELAVRGLLVPQDPTDEPASELLKKIAAEKAKLVKEGRVKKEKPQPPISGEEMLFPLPKGWTWIRNASLFGLRKGRVPKDISESGEIPYLDIEALDRGNVRRYTNDTSIPRATSGDLLVVCDGSRSGLVLNGKDGAIGSTLSVIETPKFIQAFVRLLFLHGFERLNSAMRGAAIPHLDTAKLLSEVTGLPPLAEQHRIVAKVDELMALCDQLEQHTDASLGAHQMLVDTLLSALTSATDHAQFASAWQRIAGHFDTLFTTEDSIDQLKQTILQLAVMGKLVPQDPNDEPASELLKKIAAEKARLVKEGKIRNAKQLLPIAEDEKPFELPSGWAFCRLQELVSTLGDGLHGTPIYDNAGDYRFINGNNLSNGDIVIKSDTKRVGQTEYEKHRKKLDDSTVLVSINGTIGNVAFFKGEQVILGKSVCYFNLLSGIEKLFIKRFIESPFFFDYAASQATGSTISNLGLKAMNAFPIPLPPASEQVRIIAKLDELFALCDQLKFRLSAAQTTQLHLTDALVERAIC